MSVKKSYSKRSKIRLIIDNKEFISKADFAEYLFVTYSISKSATEQRLRKGYSEQECMLSRNESYKISVKESYRKKSKIRLIIDNKEFFTKADFAEYLFVTYSISKRATIQRLLHGYSEQECMLSLSELRKIIAKRSIVSKSTK
jgi:pyruvate/2-oxoacid:ferredoxin oxidoreductase alpha subunit